MIPALMAAGRAALGAVGRAGIAEAAGARLGAVEASAARRTIAARGGAWRQAMNAAGGDRNVAREMMQQKAHEIREQQQQQKQQMMDEAREQANAQRQAAQEAQARQPALMKAFKNNPSAAAADVGTGIVTNNFRGLATSALPREMAETLQAFGRLVDAIDARGRELSMYNGPLAGAVAHADVRKMKADIFEANVAGESYGKVIEQQSKLEAGLQEAFAPIKAQIADLVAGFLQLLNDYMPEIKAFCHWMRDAMIATKVILADGYRATVEAIQGEFTKATKLIEGIPGDIADEIMKANEKERKKIDLEPWFSDPLLALAPELQPVAPAAIPNPLGAF